VKEVRVAGPSKALLEIEDDGDFACAVLDALEWPDGGRVLDKAGLPESLSVPQRHALATWFLYSRVCNAGFFTTISNNYGPLFPDAAQAHRAIGAPRCAALIEKVIGFFPGGVVPLEEDLLILDPDTGDWLDPHPLEEQIEALNGDYYALNDGEEPILSLLAAYIRARPDEFFSD
jgi:hypothetical protein